MNKRVKGYSIPIEKETLKNKFFRRVLYTSHHSQLVLMNLLPKEEIGMEVHQENDQFFRFEKGKGKCIINNKEYIVKDGSALVIPAGTKHNVINISETEDLKMYTLYSPPHHKDGTIHKTKNQAEKDDEDFDGKTTE